MLLSVHHVDLGCHYVRAASSRVNNTFSGTHLLSIIQLAAHTSVNNTVSGTHLPRTFTLLKYRHFS
jgi:hypothetical protein